MPAKMTPEQYKKENQLLKKQIEEKTGKTCEQWYDERNKRSRDAMELRIPDQVPFTIRPNVQRYTGVPNSSAYYDPIAFKTAARQAVLDFQPDMSITGTTGFPSSGEAMEALDVKNKLWPGGPLPPDYDFQALETEFMKEDEYDMFLNDPSDFMIRRYFPRMYGALKPFADLPPLGNMLQGIEYLTPTLISPEFLKAAKAIAKAGKKTQQFRETLGNVYDDLVELGFPPYYSGNSGIGGAPFDTVSSSLRGMKGSMLDMYRRPERLLKLIDTIIDKRIAEAKPAAPEVRGTPRRVNMPLWRGDKAFMSQKQFEKFYWPGLKKALQAHIDLGYIPMPVFEAEFAERLEFLLELPKGKVMPSIEYVDAVLAKDILKDHACIVQRIPGSSKLWPVQQVEDCVKDLIKKVGKGGGLIIDVKIPDTGTPEQLRKMMDNLREAARY
jgi:hypothetical protein